MKRLPRYLLSLAPIAFALALALSAAPAFAHGPDAGGTGWFSHEISLAPGNVNTSHFQKTLTISVDDQVYAQPLVCSGCTIVPQTGTLAGQTIIANVLYVATMGNTVYAFDADSGVLYWKLNVGATPLTGGPRASSDIPDYWCGNYSGHVGIASTPAGSGSNMYVVSRIHAPGCSGTNCAQYYINGINAVNGTLWKSVLMSGGVIGKGDGSIVVNFNANYENQRAALTVVNGHVLVAFASYCDNGTFGSPNNSHGWVMSYDATTLNATDSYISTPDGSGGGIWQSGAGPAWSGNVAYFAVSNRFPGSSSATAPMGDSQSIVGLQVSSTNLIKTVQYVIPNSVSESNGDVDLGATGSIIPGNSSLIQIDKAGNLYQINLSGQALQSSFPAVNNSLGSWVAYNAGAYANSQYFIWGSGDVMKAYAVSPSSGLVARSPSLQGSVTYPAKMFAGGMSISSNGSQNGIVWATALTGTSPDPGNSNVPGMLYAFDASNLHELWDSKQRAGNADTLGTLAKWVPPTIANGKVYVATFDKQILVYSNPPVFWGQDYNVQFSPTGGDWDPGFYKGECRYAEVPNQSFDFQAMTGLSEFQAVLSSQQQAHALLCSEHLHTANSTASCVVERFDNSLPANNAYNWDIAGNKAECPANYAAVGVSQSTSGQLHALLCCNQAFTFPTNATNCKTEVMFNQDSPDVESVPGNPDRDWDGNYYKGQCPIGSIVTGVSGYVSSPASMAPHAVLCCAP